MADGIFIHPPAAIDGLVWMVQGGWLCPICNSSSFQNQCLSIFQTGNCLESTSTIQAWGHITPAKLCHTAIKKKSRRTVSPLKARTQQGDMAKGVTLEPCFPGGPNVKETACNVGDPDLILIPVLERSSAEGNGSLLQHSCLDNSIVRPKIRAFVPRRKNCVTQ